jgi:hypothetical protein
MQIYFPGLTQFKDFLFSMQLKLKKGAITTNPTNQFLLAIEIFGCLHKYVDVLLHNYTNAI